MEAAVFFGLTMLGILVHFGMYEIAKALRDAIPRDWNIVHKGKKED